MTRFDMRWALGVLAVIAGVSIPARAEPATKPAGLSIRENGGAYEIVDAGKPVLRYNYQVVPEPPEVKGKIAAGSRKYAIPRSDYLHPIYGPDGEVLTADWMLDHPHHRGVYWAWPEVDWQGKRADLHALQTVFARPTGKIETETGADFVQIVAENEWRWEDKTPIVREQATIRAYRRVEAGRCIDLIFRFTAIDADVKVARRGQKHYGGLNVRLGAGKDQKILTHADPATAPVRRAWAHRNAIPQGGQGVVGLSILQSRFNPDYPGDWIQYPNLSWVQPTFPAADTRYTITRDKPLELRYRLWIHAGPATPELLNKLWDEYNAK